MVSRLVVVGLVGALGISVPTWPELREWMNAANNRIACQLAAWDASAGGDADLIVVPPIAPAVVDRPRSAPVAGSTASDLIVVDEHPSGLAYELNREAEGPGGPASSAQGIGVGQAGKPDLPGDRAEFASDARRRDEFSLALPHGTPEGRLMAELVQAVRSADREPAGPEARGALRTALDRVPCTFSPSCAVPPPAPAAATAATAPVPPAVPAPDRTNRLSDAMPGTGQALDCFADPSDQPVLVLADSSPAEPAFEPIDPATIPGLAEQLNLTAEGLTTPASATIGDHPAGGEAAASRASIPPAPDPADSAPGPTPHVVHAVRLTGQALHAWMNVLAGPAIVQVSAQ
jgi:hypothetical protein